MSGYSVGKYGEYADSPVDLPRRGWWQVLRRVYAELMEDRLSVIAAGVAYYCLLSVFPAIALLITVYGMIGDPVTVREQISALRQIMPSDAYAILGDQLQKVSGATSGGLGIGAAISFVLASWSASRAINALMIALNVAYEEEEKRSFLRKNLVALAMTFGAVCFFILSVIVIAAVPAAIQIFGVGDTLTKGLASLRWIAFGLAAIIALALVYRFAPSRAPARFRWLSPGAVVAMGLWLISSLLFSFYVANFGSYNETFGSIGAVIVLLFWFYLAAYAVFIGAELNAELERQTYRDSTTGPIRPIGRRGAFVADHTAKTSES